MPVKAFIDTNIVIYALETDCDTLYTEDLHNGQVIGGSLTVINPFAG